MRGHRLEVRLPRAAPQEGTQGEEQEAAAGRVRAYETLAADPERVLEARRGDAAPGREGREGEREQHPRVVPEGEQGADEGDDQQVPRPGVAERRELHLGKGEIRPHQERAQQQHVVEREVR